MKKALTLSIGACIILRKIDTQCERNMSKNKKLRFRKVIFNEVYKKKSSFFITRKPLLFNLSLT